MARACSAFCATIFAGEVISLGEDEVVLRRVEGSARDPLIAGEIESERRARTSRYFDRVGKSTLDAAVGRRAVRCCSTGDGKLDLALDDVIYGRAEHTPVNPTGHRPG